MRKIIRKSELCSRNTLSQGFREQSSLLHLTSSQGFREQSSLLHLISSQVSRAELAPASNIVAGFSRAELAPTSNIVAGFASRARSCRYNTEADLSWLKVAKYLSSIYLRAVILKLIVRTTSILWIYFLLAKQSYNGHLCTTTANDRS